ncbi:MAG: peptidoglycan editing factor PgeF [Alphaproteobacteria bacterium]|nr:peptidoglycan editing factor PgeF [Alphaproteobacteria bacterium]
MSNNNISCSDSSNNSSCCSNNNNYNNNCRKCSNKIDCIAVCSKNISVPHGFFGRKGGKSSGLYESLNCSDYVGDSLENVSANLDIAKEYLGGLNPVSKLITLKQIHSNICIEVSKETESGIEADAMVTKEKNIAIGILTADCTPILFFDPVQSVVGAAHAGWRGAVGGVIEATIKSMRNLGCEPQNIVAAIGPCIGRNSYEIDDDFKRNFSGSGDCFCLINMRLHFNLPKFCRQRLLKSGITEANIETIDIDTYKNCNNYFSYRFATKNSDGICGRQISAIVCV